MKSASELMDTGVGQKLTSRGEIFCANGALRSCVSAEAIPCLEGKRVAERPNAELRWSARLGAEWLSRTELRRHASSAPPTNRLRSTGRRQRRSNLGLAEPARRRHRRELDPDQVRPRRSMQAFSPIVMKPCPLQLFCPLQELLAVLHCACPLQALAP